MESDRHDDEKSKKNQDEETVDGRALLANSLLPLWAPAHHLNLKEEQGIIEIFLVPIQLNRPSHDEFSPEEEALFKLCNKLTRLSKRNDEDNYIQFSFQDNKLIFSPSVRPANHEEWLNVIIKAINILYQNKIIDTDKIKSIIIDFILNLPGVDNEEKKNSIFAKLSEEEKFAKADSSCKLSEARPSTPDRLDDLAARALAKSFFISSPDKKGEPSKEEIDDKKRAAKRRLPEELQEKVEDEFSKEKSTRKGPKG